MNVRKIKEIIKFDVERSIQNKWFVILNVVMFIAILVATNWSNISSFLEDHNINIASSEEFTIQVLDNENLVYSDIEEEFKEDKNIKIEKVTENKYSKKNVPKDDMLLVEVKSDSKKILSIKVVSKEAVDGVIYDRLYEILKEVRSKVFASNNGITIEDLEVLSEDLNIKREMLGVEADNSDAKEMIKLVATMVVYMCLIIVLSRIANEIANEKVSKSIEYVLTSVSAKEYLLAKVLSSTITIVVQLIYSVIYYMIGNMVSSLFVSTTVGTSGVSLNVVGNIDKEIVTYVLAMICYLIFTVFLTTLIQAALSSKTTSVTEAGNTTILLLMIVVLLYILSNGIITPYTKVTPIMYIISCLPIVSTFFVPSMMIIGQATALQIIVSFVLLILSIPLIFNFCAKVFKNGVLDYTSKKKSLFATKTKKEENISLIEKQDLELRKSKAKKYAFTIGMAMILFVILQMVSSLVLSFTLPTYLSDKFDISTILVIENSLILIISLSLSSLFIKFYSTDIVKEKRKELKGTQKFEIIFMGIAVIAFIQFIVTYLYEKFGINQDVIANAGIVPQKTFGGILIFIIGMALIPALFEELLFRNWILNASKKYGKVFAIVFSAVLFGLYHMNVSQGVFAFLIGVLFGVIAVGTGTIKYTCLLHFLNNLYACLGMILGTESIAFKFLFNIVIAVSIVGAMLIIKNLPNIKKVKKEDLKINKDCKFLLRNYTFVLSMILIVVMFVATNNIIS